MTATRTDLPPHIAQRAQRVFRQVRSRLAHARLLSLREATAQAAEEVHRAAAQLHTLADGTYAGSRAGQAARELEAIGAGLAQLSEDLGRPFLLFVVGMGKFGKSTLINALLGQRVADMDALPKTWKIDVFTHTLPEGVAEVRTYQGKVERLSVDEARRLIAQEERRREESENKVWELFQERSRQLRSVADKEVLRRELETLHLYRSPIVEVKWPVQKGGISGHFDVVDTPGLWQERPDRRRPADDPAGADSHSFSLVSSEDLRSYYLQADGVLWMLDATKLAAGKPHELMTELNAALHRVGGVARNAVAVLNRIDLVRRNGGDEAVERVVYQAHGLLAGLFRHVIPLSAREALEAQETRDGERLRASGLPDLIAVIDQEFRVGGADVRWWSKWEGRHQYLLQAETVSQKYRHELSEAEVQLKQRAAEAERHLGSLRKRAQQRLDEALSQYRMDVMNRLQENMSRLLQLQNVDRYDYLRNEVFRIERLRNRFENLLRNVEKEFAVAVEELVPFQRFTAFRYADPRPLPRLTARFLSKWDLSYIDVEAGDWSRTGRLAIAGAASIVGASILGPLGLILGPIVSETLFGEYLSSVRENQVEINIRKQLDGLTRSIEEQWEDAVRTLTRQAEGHLSEVRETSFAYVHVPVSRVGEAREILGSVETVAHWPVPELKVSQLTLDPWIRQHGAGRGAR